jgi:glycerate-2-kinase
MSRDLQVTREPFAKSLSRLSGGEVEVACAAGSGGPGLLLDHRTVLEGIRRQIICRIDPGTNNDKTVGG